MKACYRRGMTAIISFGFLFFVWYTMGIYLETNDDRYIASILSGALTGEPDAHAVYLNYLLSLPLVGLYRITTNIPWYGGMLVLFQMLAFWGILDSACSKCRRWYHMMPVIGLTACVFGAFCYDIGQIQYTSTAMLLAIAGYVSFLLYEDIRERVLGFFVFELLACLLRTESMLLLIPIGIVAVLGSIFFEKESELQEKIRQGCAVCGALFVVIVIAALANWIGYHGEDWERYQRFNDARTAMFDYYGKPDETQVGEILKQYDVSPAKYNAFLAHVILDWTEDVECAEALEEYSRLHGQKRMEMGELIQKSWKESFGDFEWDLNRVLVAAWLIYGAWMLLNRRWSMLVLGGGMLLVRIAVWTWMHWRGRMPLRVTLPLLACEVILLLALAWREVAIQEKLSWQKVGLLVGCVLLGVLSLQSAKLQYRYIKNENNVQQVYIEGYKELLEYCNRNEQNRYLLDSTTVSWYRGEVFENEIYQSANAVVSGGWFSNAPMMQQHLQEYLGSAENGIYAILYADGSEAGHPMLLYLEEEMGCQPKLADMLTVSHGGSYAVYYFEGAFPFDEKSAK